MKFNLEGRFSITCLSKTVAEVLSHPEARKEFEDWYRNTYGKDYVWKTKEEHWDQISNKEVI